MTSRTLLCAILGLKLGVLFALATPEPRWFTWGMAKARSAYYAEQIKAWEKCQEPSDKPVLGRPECYGTAKWLNAEYEDHIRRTNTILSVRTPSE